MEVQKVSGPPPATATVAPRPVVRERAETAPKESEPTVDRLARAAQTLSAGMPPHVKLQLDVDRNTNLVIGRVVDKETGEVVRQIPSKEMIALLQRSAELSVLFDKSI